MREQKKIYLQKKKQEIYDSVETSAAAGSVETERQLQRGFSCY